MDDCHSLKEPVYVFPSAQVRDGVLTPFDGNHCYLMDTGTFWVWQDGWQPLEG